MIDGINAVLIATRDVPRLAAFYRDKVGIPLVINDHGSGTHAETHVGKTHFAIFSGSPTPQPEGPVMVSLHVDDIDAEYARLSARGIVFDGPPRAMPFGGIVTSFRDPDGNGVCLMVWENERKAKA